MPYPTKFSAIIEGNNRYFYEKRHRKNVWPPRQLFGRPNTGRLKRKKSTGQATGRNKAHQNNTQSERRMEEKRAASTAKTTDVRDSCTALSDDSAC